MAAAAEAIAVPPMPVKWTDLISDENIGCMMAKSTKQKSQNSSLQKQLFPGWDRFGRVTSPLVLITLPARMCEKGETICIAWPLRNNLPTVPVQQYDLINQ
jgi:hypothetical protein